MTKPPQHKTQAKATQGGSALGRYQQVIVGRRGWVALLYFELCTWMSPVPGALGLLLRKAFWPRLFHSCGPGTVFGANVSLRHPHRIALGSNVVVSDGCILDARNEDADVALSVGEDSILANNVMISCKGGTTRIGARAGIGAQTIIHAVAGSEVEMGNDLIIGPACYIAGGGNYNIERTDVPMAQQGLREGESTRLGDDVWLGARVTILPGVTIGCGSVAAAGAVLTESIPERSVCAGVPARVIRQRGQSPPADYPES